MTRVFKSYNRGGGPVTAVVMPCICMGPKTAELVSILDDIIELLHAGGEDVWQPVMVASRSRLNNSDYSGIELLLNSFGGMGSFNDLVIGQYFIDGEFAWKDGADAANDKLQQLRSQAYDLAFYIKHNHEITPA